MKDSTAQREWRLPLGDICATALDHINETLAD
jgi:hypothetical protein